MTVVVVVAITAFALVAGAAWGAFGHLPPRVEGFIVSAAGGALIVSLMDELIRPATEVLPIWAVCASVAAGSLAFTGADTWLDRRLAGAGGLGLLLAVTFDGVPENLALGTALIGSGPLQVAALAGSIFLSNLPEAAGGARQMRKDGYRRRNIVLIWTAVAILLSAAAIGGYAFLDTAPRGTTDAIRCVAAGAVLSSLATEVFPKADDEEHNVTGIAVATGLILALLLSSLG